MNAYDVIIAIIFSIALIVIIWILVRGKPGGIDGNMNLSQVCAIVEDRKITKTNRKSPK